METSPLSDGFGSRLREDDSVQFSHVEPPADAAPERRPRKTGKALRKFHEEQDLQWGQTMTNHEFFMKDNAARIEEMDEHLSWLRANLKNVWVITREDIQGLMARCKKLEVTIQQINRYVSSTTKAMNSKMDMLIDLNERKREMHVVDTLQTVWDNCYIQVGNNVGTSSSDLGSISLT